MMSDILIGITFGFILIAFVALLFIEMERRRYRDAIDEILDGPATHFDAEHVYAILECARVKPRGVVRDTFHTMRSHEHANDALKYALGPGENPHLPPEYLARIRKELEPAEYAKQLAGEWPEIRENDDARQIPMPFAKKEIEGTRCLACGYDSCFCDDGFAGHLRRKESQ